MKVLATRILDVANEVKPALSKQSFNQNEAELWKIYQKLQRERLAILDLSHEWEFIEETTQGLSKEIELLLRDAIEELTDHVAILTETYRAHIDILEIKNSRQLTLIALIASVIVSYAALWEFFVREFLLTLQFPYGLSPYINYIVLLISLVPMFIAVWWGWHRRVTG